jgi:hypothetical protein
LKSISGEQAKPEDLKLPICFALSSQTHLRLARDSVDGEQSDWETREELWSSFWKHRGKERLERSGKAAVGGNSLCLRAFRYHKLISCLEAFWVDITLRNPLDTEVNLANLTVVVESPSGDTAWVGENIAIEILEEIVLNVKESRTVRGVGRSPRSLADYNAFSDFHCHQVL